MRKIYSWQNVSTHVSSGCSDGFIQDLRAAGTLFDWPNKLSTLGCEKTDMCGRRLTFSQTSPGFYVSAVLGF